MKRVFILKASVVGGVCAVAGIAGGIAESSAATDHRAAQRSGPSRPPGRSPGASTIRSGGGPVGFGSRAIHATAIEPASDGGYAFVTYDTGALISVGSDSLVVREGSDSITYKRPTLVLKGTTTVWLDGITSRLSALAAPDRVAVIRSSSGTNTILATTPTSGAALPGPGSYGPSQGLRSDCGRGWTGHSGWAGPGGWTGQGGWTGRGGRAGTRGQHAW